MKLNKNSIVGVRLTCNVRDALFEGTQKSNISPSDYIRNLINQNLSKDFELECSKYNVSF
tara:strand:- start:804 stop:983 length:180 start_codon:yes stop_codon:yes gene_type:complete